MCYWELYKAESFYHSTAQGYAAQALATAVRLKDKTSQRERLYIEAAVAEEASPPGGGPPKLEIMPDALLQPLVGSLSVMSLELRASLIAAHGKVTEAKDLFARATQQEEALGYREAPNYIRPVGETEGAAMVIAGEWVEAEAAYRRALVERPRSGFALYGIALTSEKSGDSAAATKEYAAFLAAWHHADPELPQVRHAQSYLARAQQ
jgi:hypothetical protein